QPSLMYEHKGAKMSEMVSNTSNAGLTSELGLGYLTLPVDLLFKPQMPNGSGSWIIGVGPYVGYGISGKMSLSSDQSEDELEVGDPFKHSEININNGETSFKGDPLLK